MSSPLTGSRAGSAGFTLIELMIVVVIVGILASIALPSYADYVRRSKIIEATSRLADQRVRMEQYFLDNRTYAGGCAATLTGKAEDFKITCSDETATTYKVKAEGSTDSMKDFIYTIDQNNTRVTEKTYWGKTSATCWVVRKDGSCS